MCLGHMTMLIIEILMILEQREIIGRAKREQRECRKRVQEESRCRVEWSKNRSERENRKKIGRV